MTTIYVLLTLVCYSFVCLLLIRCVHFFFFAFCCFYLFSCAFVLIQTLRDNMHLIKSHTQCSCYVSCSFASVFSSGSFSTRATQKNEVCLEMHICVHASSLSLSDAWPSSITRARSLSHLILSDIVPLQSIPNGFV